MCLSASVALMLQIHYKCTGFDTARARAIVCVKFISFDFLLLLSSRASSSSSFQKVRFYVIISTFDSASFSLCLCLSLRLLRLPLLLSQNIALLIVAVFVTSIKHDTDAAARHSICMWYAICELRVESSAYWITSICVLSTLTSGFYLWRWI